MKMPDTRTPEEKETDYIALQLLGQLARRIPTQEQLLAMEKPSLLGFIVLGRKKESSNSFNLGLIENSFSMGESPERAQFHWSSNNVTSNFGGSFKIDGYVEATAEKKRAEARLSQYEWVIYDVHGWDIPVLLDWDEWRAAQASGYTLSGVIDKFRARNVRFFMKEF